MGRTTYMLFETFFHVKRDKAEDISSHVAELQKLFVDLNDELTKHEENTLSERILNGRILSTLGKEYDNFKDLWDTIPTENQNLNLLIENLCAIELREQSTTDVTALVAYYSQKKMMSKEQAKQKFPCNKYKQLGNWAAEWPQNPRDCNNERQKEKVSENAVFTLCATGASTVNYIDVNKWYCDTGATKHITPNKQYFVLYSEFDVPEVVSLGRQGTNMHALGKGTVYIEIRRNNECYRARLENVLYVRVVRPENSDQVNIATSETLQMYRERFGHQNKQHIKNI
ncbi:uncharacterized protein LOC126235416 [Schistocerca nitens]|uniref:uncharacterized protein LOC126235416 n=1 Tax=Schistocerca nitens TaxID=7011 RepID=UPI00211937AB|nr:uncharacterized protein LOC126235416 [Schistocerca nitens]